MRWEKAGKIKKPKRDWRGWRFYYEEDIEVIKQFVESSYEYDGENGVLVNAAKSAIVLALVVGLSLICAPSYGATNFAPRNTVPQQAIVETPSAVDIHLDALQAVKVPESLITEDIKYTLGPNDIIEIEVRRHPEFSGQYIINSEGKIEYKFIGDIVVTGLTKNELKERLTEILSEFLIEPEIDVAIVAYLSKVFYVVGDVHRPGKFYMRGNTVMVREAIMQSGLPTDAAAMRRCRLITPSQTSANNYVEVDIFSLLYEGNLKQNLEMQPGDVLYIPATFIAKMIRVVSPLTNIAGQTAGAALTGAAIIP
jgi:polysaccharide export outer membrane protein